MDEIKANNLPRHQVLDFILEVAKKENKAVLWLPEQDRFESIPYSLPS